MKESKRSVVAIIGGGFAGAMVAVHLLKQTEKQLHIILINTKYPLAKGVAYSSYSHKHLLNVKAKNMSAFPDKPSDFITWIKNHEKYGVLDNQTMPEMFLPRNVYGHYLKDVFDNAIREKAQGVSIEFVHDEAIEIEDMEVGMQINFSISPSVFAHRVILAMGNQAPRQPELKNGSLSNNKRYFPNPWVNEAVLHPEENEDVLIIGNGLTMVDVVLGLREKNYRGKIHSLSPNGFKILPHREFEPYHDLVKDVQPPFELIKLVKLFRFHVQSLRAKGIAGEAAVDSLRPLTQKIWMALSLDEKKRFMLHLRHMWGVARHRLPMEVHKQFQQMILDETLEIIAGRIHSITESNHSLEVSIYRRSRNELLTIKVGRIINCTGPEADITKMNVELIQNLLAQKLIEPDELSLGINALPDGTIITKDGKPSDKLFAIGSLLKGILWESTAVPEIRVQAKNLADKIIKLNLAENLKII
jgi:uncharacterized NAD(P)/FAD-binding protein YdhS